MNRHIALAYFLSLLTFNGCSGAATPDTGPTSDAPTTTDNDGDGVIASLDCDDSDPAASTTASRACSSACGTGTETCTSGTWGTCSAPTDCVCTTDGEMRVGPCGMCGMQSQRCTSGAWTAASACLGEGACVPAAVESRDTDMCGTEQRLCGATCAWGEWLQATADGECRPGIRRSCPDFLNFSYCDETCHWGACP